MLYLVGLGLGDAEDISVKGLRVVRSCSRVYLEAYTSILTVGKEALEEFYGRDVILADRDLVELQAEEILREADVSDVAFLVVGDPFGATTHTDLVLRAVHAGIPYRVIHNASILNAVGCVGLQLYNFGEVVSIVFWTSSWKPESFYDKIQKNREAGLHTLCLLDIKVKERSDENLMRGRDIFEPPRFMSVAEAATQLLEVVERRRSLGEEPGLTEDTLCVGVARLGSCDQLIRSGSLRQLASCNLGRPLHCMLVPGHLHEVEAELLSTHQLQEAELLNTKPGGGASVEL